MRDKLNELAEWISTEWDSGATPQTALDLCDSIGRDLARTEARVAQLEEALKIQHQHVSANKTLPHNLCEVCDTIGPAALEGDQR